VSIRVTTCHVVSATVPIPSPGGSGTKVDAPVGGGCDNAPLYERSCARALGLSAKRSRLRLFGASPVSSGWRHFEPLNRVDPLREHPLPGDTPAACRAHVFFDACRVAGGLFELSDVKPAGTTLEIVRYSRVPRAVLIVFAPGREQLYAVGVTHEPCNLARRQRRGKAYEQQGAVARSEQRLADHLDCRVQAVEHQRRLALLGLPKGNARRAKPGGGEYLS
jgi:hypothetical protein